MHIVEMPIGRIAIPGRIRCKTRLPFIPEIDSINKASSGSTSKEAVSEGVQKYSFNSGLYRNFPFANTGPAISDMDTVFPELL